MERHPLESLFDEPEASPLWLGVAWAAFGLVASLFAALLFIVLSAQLNKPEVHVSWTTGKCVRVVDPRAEREGAASKWSCANKPTDYDLVWVE